jgi:hypothetical protein
MKRRSFVFGTAAMAVPLPGVTAVVARLIDGISHAGNETGDCPAPAWGESGAPTTYLTFDEVEQTSHEVTYEEVADVFGGPMSKHPVVSVKAHPEIVWIRPDMGIGTIANPFAFGVGDPARRVRWREVKRSLMKGYLPIVVSRWQDGPVLFEQLAFATLLEDLKVRTGHEKQVAIVRMAIANTDPSEDQHAVLWAFVPATVAAKGILPPPKDEPNGFTYDDFDVIGSLPSVSEIRIATTDEIIRDGQVMLGIHREDAGIKTTVYTKAFKFETDLRPGQRKNVYLEVSTNKKGFSNPEVEKLRKLDFFSTLDRRVLDLETILAQGTKICVPEDVVNNIYKAQILHSQSQMVQAAERDYYMPVYGYLGVWVWDIMKTLVPLDAMGYREDVAKSLEYFLRIQGRYPPHGQIRTSEGAFSGTGVFEESGWEKDDESTIYGLLAKLQAGKERHFPAWMNWTGAVLYAFGEHYFYTNDRDWLQRVAPALVRGCNWIINERQATKQKDAQGQKVLHYGLLPAGQAYDAKYDNPTYYPCWTDGYSYQGLERAAEALVEIGHPEAQRLLKEAANYREDVLEVMRRTRQTDPNLPPYPERLYQPPGWADFATGALAFVDTGFLGPHDPAFTQLEEYMKKNFNRGVLGLTGRLRADEDKHAPNCYYIGYSEDIWQRAWMLRGEVEKALLAFYSMLAFGADKDTLCPVERFDLYDPRYAPFSMHAEGCSRICGIIRKGLLMEESRVLYLLAGAPRRWLEDGKTIELRDALTYFGKFDLSITSQAQCDRIQADLALHKSRPERLKRVRLRLPHPTKRSMKVVTVNSKTWASFNPEEEVIELKPDENRYQIVVQY